MSEFAAKVVAKLDTNDFIRQIKNAGQDNPVTIKNITVDTPKLISQVQKALENRRFTITIGDIKFDSTTAPLTQKIGKSLASRINAELQNGKIEASIARVTQQYDRLGNSGHEKLSRIQADIAQLNALNAKMSKTADVDELVQSYRKYNDVLERVKNSLSTVTAETKMMATGLQVSDLDNKMRKWLESNSKAAKGYGEAIESLRRKLKSGYDGGSLTTGDMAAIAEEFKKIDIAADRAGKKGKSFGDQFNNVFSTLTKYVSATSMIYASVNAIKQGITVVKDLDTSLIDLAKTAQASASQLTQFYYEANDVAKEYGSTTQEIIQSAADWSRLGYSLSDSKAMAKYASMFKSISPGMDIDDATTGLVSIMKAYGVDAENVLDDVISKINEIGNTAATSNDQIVIGLQQSSAAMATMGSTLDENIALFTAAQEITQDASKVGNALRTIAMRIRGYDEETEQLSADLVNITGECIDLTKTAESPNGVSLFKDAEQTEYKSVYEYLQDISKIYDELAAKQKQALLEKLFGKNRASVGAAILDNFSAAEKAMDTMRNSAGSAEAEMDTITQSLEYRLNALKETATGIFQNLFRKEDMGAAISALSGFLNIIDMVTDKLGLLGTVGVGAGLVALIKNFSTLREMGESRMAFNGAVKFLGANADDIAKVSVAVKGLSAANAAAVVSTTALSDAQKVAALMSAGLTQAEAEQALAAAASKAANTGAGAAAAMASAGFAGLGASVKAATVGLVEFLATNPIGWAVLAVSAVALVSKAAGALIETMDEAIDKAGESRDAYNSTMSELDQINSQLDATKGRIDELKAQGALSVTDKAELAQLMAQNEQLERQKEIKERIAELEGKQAAKDADNVLTKGGTDIIEETIEMQRQLNEYQSEYDAVLERQAKTKPETSKWFEGYTDYENNQMQLEGLEGEIDSLNAGIAENLTEINTQYGSLFDADGNVIAGYEDTARRCEELFDQTMSLTDRAAKAEQDIEGVLARPAFSGFEDELVAIAKGTDNAGIKASDLTGKYAALARACAESGVDIAELIDYINSAAGIINVDEVRSQLSEAFDVEEQRDEFDGFLEELGADDLKIAYEIVQSNDTSGWTIEDFRQEIYRLKEEKISVSLETDMQSAQGLVEGLGAVQGILGGQATGKSISLEDFNSGELDDYADAIEYVNGALQLNAERVREISEAKAEEAVAYNNSQKAIAQSKYLDNAAEIERLRDAIRGHSYAEGESESAIRGSIDALLSENETLRQTCTAYDLMNNSITEATGAYQTWLNAQESAQSGDMFDSARQMAQLVDESLNKSDSEYYGRTGNANYLAAVDFLIPDTIDGDDEDAVNSYLESIKGVFSASEDSSFAGLDIGAFCKRAVESGLMVYDEAKDEYSIAGKQTMESFAEGMNMSLPLVQAAFGEMQEFEIEFDWADEADKTFGDVAVSANEAAEALKKIPGYGNLDIRLNTDSISELDTTIAKMQEIKGRVSIDSSEAEYANSIIRYCVEQEHLLSDPVVMSVDTSLVDGRVGDAIGLLQELQTALDELDTDKKLGIDTADAQAKVDGIVAKIQSTENLRIMGKLDIDTTDLKSIKSSIRGLDEAKLVKYGVDQSAIIGYKAPEKTSTVKYEKDSKEVDDYKPAPKVGMVTFHKISTDVDRYNPRNLERTVTYHLSTTNAPTSPTSLLGTHAPAGAAKAGGQAKAGGDWGVPSGGTMLVGELGREICVDPRSGKWYTVGDRGAEFRNIPRGTIIFNHLQTESLLKNGAARGRAAAMAYGSAYVTGTIKVPKQQTFASDSGSGSGSGSDGGSEDVGSEHSDGESEFEEEEKTALEKFKDWFGTLFDWIEVKIERQVKRVDFLTSRAEASAEYGNYGWASTHYRAAAYETSKQIGYEKAASDRYNAQAESVLSEAVNGGVITQGDADSIRANVRAGTIDISAYSEEMREVISSYKQWYDKAKDASDSLYELHRNVRKYIEDIKEMRDAQRDAKLDAIGSYTDIVTSGTANGAKRKNNVLAYQNKQLGKQNKAYEAETRKLGKDAAKVGSRASKSLSAELGSDAAKGDAAYARALGNALRAIKAKRPVAEADVKLIKRNPVVYNQVFAYNIAVRNVETARLEEAVNYAANNADVYSNIQEKYKNKDDATNSTIDLLEKRSENAGKAKKKNKFLQKAASQYDDILRNDDAEIKEYKQDVSKSRKKVSKGAGTTEGIALANKKTRKAVRAAVKQAKSAVKAKKPIKASVIAALAKYYSKGFVTRAFYEACVNYNDALESLELAKEQKDIDVEDAKAARAQIGAEMVDNISQEYDNKLNANADETTKMENRQEYDETRGIDRTEDDYRQLIDQSKKEQALNEQAAAAVQKQIQQNLASGLWTTDSQEYHDAIQQMNGYANAADECKIEQEEFNNEIAQLPYTNLEKMLDLLDSIKGNYESVLAIAKAKGLSETESQYATEIGNAEMKKSRYEEMRSQAWEDYQKALSSADGVYGGKTSNEWLALYYDYDTEVNNLTADVIELNNAIANLPYESMERVLDVLESVQALDESDVDLKEAMGIDLDAADYEKQMKDIEDQIAEYEQGRAQAYGDYLKAAADPEGVYGGKTAEQWLAQYNEYGKMINDMRSDIEGLKDALRDDVFWRTFERAHDAAKRFGDLLSGLSGLLDGLDYFDDDGKLTDFGVAEVGNLVKQYENARDEVQNYQDDIGNLNRLYADGMYTQQEYTEKLGELQKGMLDSAASMKKFAETMVDMYEEMAKSQLDALMELIDARNDALSKKKEYYDYDKTIKDKTKDIQTLEAEIAALEGVETAEAKAKRAMYEAQLAEKKGELDDTVQEHMFDLSKDALEELKETLQDAFDDKWENMNSNLEEMTRLMAAANQLTESSAGTIIETMDRLLAFYGIDPVASEIGAAYAGGTRRVPGAVNALTNERGNEIIVTKGGMIAPLSQGDGVLPSYLTDRLYDLAINGVEMPEVPSRYGGAGAMPATISQHYDSLINIEGSADAATVEDLKAMSRDIMEKSYEYTSRKIYSGYMHAGGKRSV